jgi:hypothetical protein
MMAASSIQAKRKKAMKKPVAVDVFMPSISGSLAPFEFSRWDGSLQSCPDDAACRLLERVICAEALKYQKRVRGLAHSLQVLGERRPGLNLRKKLERYDARLWDNMKPEPEWVKRWRLLNFGTDSEKVEAGAWFKEQTKKNDELEELRWENWRIKSFLPSLPLRHLLWRAGIRKEPDFEIGGLFSNELLVFAHHAELLRREVQKIEAAQKLDAKLKRAMRVRLGITREVQQEIAQIESDLQRERTRVPAGKRRKRAKLKKATA